MKFFYNSGQWAVASGQWSVDFLLKPYRSFEILKITTAGDTKVTEHDYQLLTKFLQVAETVGGDEEHQYDGSVVRCMHYETGGH